MGTTDKRMLPYASMGLLADPPPWNEHPAAQPSRELGRSVLGNSISLFMPPGKSSPNTLVMGGVHGDESEAILLAHLLLARGCPAALIPCLNPDGALLRQRWNRNNVDLNRNLPAPDWSPEPLNPRYPPGPAPASEPETQAFLKALEVLKPAAVVNLHSYKESFLELERPAGEISERLNRAIDGFTEAAGIERRLSIGYPTPGALGAFGLANGLLVLTYELERGTSHHRVEELAGPLTRLLEELEAERFAPLSTD
ncbi:MAG: DUF2817 domain-containing protein [Deltaproteobacteria bacterium]|nr:DUF2817 domain-containing protein [Deltaproteobacteria bacterium]